MKAWVDDWLPKIKNSRFGYLPITPRPYWDRETIAFAHSLDMKVVNCIKKDLKIKVRMLNNRSLFVNTKRVDSHLSGKDDVMVGFMDDDSTHYNYLGYCALVQDLAVAIVDYWSNEKEVEGQMCETHTGTCL